MRTSTILLKQAVKLKAAKPKTTKPKTKRKTRNASKKK